MVLGGIEREAPGKSFEQRAWLRINSPGPSALMCVMMIPATAWERALSSLPAQISPSSTAAGDDRAHSITDVGFLGLRQPHPFISSLVPPHMVPGDTWGCSSF